MLFDLLAEYITISRIFLIAYIQGNIMNPEDHLVVNFLLFLNFNEAANKLVESLLKPGMKISLHKDINYAVSELLERNNKLPLNSFFGFQQAVLFKEIANKYNLHQLNTPFASENDVHGVRATLV